MVMFTFNFVQFFPARQAEFSERIVMSGEHIRANLFSREIRASLPGIAQRERRIP
jgi:hypothetical protein